MLEFSSTNSIKVSDRMHPKYIMNADKWIFYMESYKGGQDYIDKYLYSHRLETEEDFAIRKQRAYYLNYCAPLANMPADFIFKKPATRPVDPILTAFRTDIDRSGNDIHAFMRKICTLSSIYGQIHILIDRPIVELDERISLGLVTKKDAMEMPHPYAVIISPLDLIDWSVNPVDNQLNWILIRESIYHDSNPFEERVEEIQYRIWTRENWTLLDKDNNILATGVHNLGIVPLVTCYHKNIDNDFIGESMLRDVAETNRAIFNWCSNIDEMIARQTFSQLICPDDGTIFSDEIDSTGKSSALKKVGASSIFTFPANAKNPPSFISPDTRQMGIIWEMIEHHVKEIFRLSGLISARSSLASVTSRTAQSYESLDMAVFFAAKAKMLEEAENKINAVVYRWYGIYDKTPENVYYPDKYDITSPTEVIDLFTKVILNAVSGTLNKELAKRLAYQILPNADDMTMEKITEEIEENQYLEDPTMLYGQTSIPSAVVSQKELINEQRRQTEPVPNTTNPKERAKLSKPHQDSVI